MFKPKFEITFGTLLDQTAAKYPDKDALVNVQRGQRFTYLELKKECDQAAKAFIKMGVKKGDHIAIWGTNVNEWVLTFFAAAKIGAVVVTVNTNYRSHELKYLLEQSDTMTLFLIEEYRDNHYIDTIYDICLELKNSLPGQGHCAQLPNLKNIVLLEDKNFSGIFNWHDFMNLGSDISDAELALAQAACQPEDVINI